MSQGTRGRRSVLGTVLLVLALLLVYWAKEKGWLQGDSYPNPTNPAPEAQAESKPLPKRETGGSSAPVGDSSEIEKHFRTKKTEVWVEGEGEVVKLLADDNDGARHQKWLMRVGSVTVLVAHNIDVASRVPLKEGDELRFRGEYIWTEKGGTLHWTHRDQSRGRKAGWIEHRGQRIE